MQYFQWHHQQLLPKIQAKFIYLYMMYKQLIKTKFILFFNFPYTMLQYVDFLSFIPMVKLVKYGSSDVSLYVYIIMYST